MRMAPQSCYFDSESLLFWGSCLCRGVVLCSLNEWLLFETHTHSHWTHIRLSLQIKCVSYSFILPSCNNTFNARQYMQNLSFFMHFGLFCIYITCLFSDSWKENPQNIHTRCFFYFTLPICIFRFQFQYKSLETIFSRWLYTYIKHFVRACFRACVRVNIWWKYIYL